MGTGPHAANICCAPAGGADIGNILRFYGPEKPFPDAFGHGNYDIPAFGADLGAGSAQGSRVLVAQDGTVGVVVEMQEIRPWKPRYGFVRHRCRGPGQRSHGEAGAGKEFDAAALTAARSNLFQPCIGYS